MFHIIYISSTNNFEISGCDHMSSDLIEKWGLCHSDGVGIPFFNCTAVNVTLMLTGITIVFIILLIVISYIFGKDDEWRKNVSLGLTYAWAGLMAVILLGNTIIRGYLNYQLKKGREQ